MKGSVAATTAKAVLRRTFAASLAAMIAVPGRAQRPLPAPPCGAEAVPTHSPPGGAPAIATWRRAELRSWQPAPCLGWSGGSRSAEAIAATFRFAGTESELPAHIGDLALHPGIRYWSTSRKAWRPLVVHAEVVDGIDGKAIAKALPSTAFVPGVTHHYAETTLDTDRTIYRLQTRERSPRRIVLATDNATRMRFRETTLFEPGALQVGTFLDLRDGGLWGYYAIARTGTQTGLLAERGDASYIKRLVALYRHVAGLQTDAEPPAMR
jgi:hypothetical protein